VSHAHPNQALRLELNNTGAWKVILRFLADDAHATGVVQESTYQLARLDTKSKWRISTDEAQPKALAYCTHDQGWIKT